MRRLKVPVKKIEKIRHDVFRLVFSSPWLASSARPGNFLHVHTAPSLTLRRPFSVHLVQGNDIHILFRIRGKGTLFLSALKKGDVLDLIGPLGNGFNLKDAGRYDHIYLVAGGIGVAPLVFLGQEIAGRLPAKQRGRVSAIIGAPSRNELLGKSDFIRCGIKVINTTEDGSCGRKGMSVDALSRELQKSAGRGKRIKIYACGPEAMFKAIAETVAPYDNITCQVSYEQFMGCGIGVCLGCAIETKNGYKRVCKDGPVFDLFDIF